MANEFYPFATGMGAYVLTNAEYQALAGRTTGYAPGLLLKEDLNSAIRQGAFVGYAWSEFLSVAAGQDALDNGQVADYLSLARRGVRNFTGSDSYLADTGAANAYAVAFTPAVAALVNGLRFTFKAANDCSGASTLDAGTGAQPLRRSDNTALQNKDILAGTLVTVRWDATDTAFRIETVVISQLGSLGAARYLAAPALLTPGVWGVNSTSGSFSATLPANPATGDQLTFVDLVNLWSISPVTLLRNGQTIEGYADDLVLNLSNQQFTLWFNGTTWKLA